MTTRTKNKQTTTWEVFQSLQEKRRNAVNLTFLLLTLNMYYQLGLYLSLPPDPNCSNNKLLLPNYKILEPGIQASKISRLDCNNAMYIFAKIFSVCRSSESLQFWCDFLTSFDVF